MRQRFSGVWALGLMIWPAATAAAELPADNAEPGAGFVVAQASAAQVQKDAFDSAKELGTVEAWDAFLSAYPTGFYSDLARAYVKKLVDEPSPPRAPVAVQPQQPGAPPATTVTQPQQAAVPAAPIPQVPAVHNGPGASDWQNTTIPLVANSSRPAYTAIVDAGGVQLTTFCHSGSGGPSVVPGLRVTGADPGVLARLTQGLAQAPAITADLSRITMTFGDGTTVPGAAATSPPQNDQVTLYINRKLPTPGDDVLERLMAGSVVTISAPPFSASFQLDGSRAALCSMLDQCGASVQGCSRVSPSPTTSSASCGRGRYRDSRGRCVREEDGQDAQINCGRGRTWVGARGACVCIDGSKRWNGKRCVARKKAGGKKRCTGGRTIDPVSGLCDCNGDSAWNGRACVKENEPPPRANNNQNNNGNQQVKQAVCGTLQVACSLGQKNACNQFNSNCR